MMMVVVVRTRRASDLQANNGHGFESRSGRGAGRRAVMLCGYNNESIAIRTEIRSPFDYNSIALRPFDDVEK